jgi:hypothetical protein
MRRVPLAAVLLALLLPGVAGAQAEPPAKKSDRVTWLGSLPEPNVISARFRDGIMYVSTLNGLSVYVVSAPAAPRRIGRLDLPHFENEDVDLGGDILLISNDPSEGSGMLYVIDISDPRDPKILSTLATGFADGGIFTGPLNRGQGTGHTASCVQECRYVYLAGGFNGIDIVDLTNPRAPRYATPSNFKAEEATGGLATHDVQFDRQGLAWIAGGGGTAAYDVSDPLRPRLVHRTNEVGDSRYDETFGTDDGSTYNDFIHHNSMRLPNSSLAAPPPGADLAGDSNVVAITEEDYNRPTCKGAGSFQTWQLAGGQLTPLDKWEVEVDPNRQTLCSAHYFDDRGGLVAQGWYEQGVRFLDVSAPADIRQVGFWVPQKSLMWGALYPPTDPSGEIVYALDNLRGIDVLRFDRPAPGERLPDVVAPPSDPPSGGSSGSGSGQSGPTAGANVRLTMSDGRRRVRAGQRLTYRVTATNTGRDFARDVMLRIDVPRAVTLIRRPAGARSRGRRLEVPLGTLAAGAQRGVTFTARVRRRPRPKAVLVRAALLAAQDADPADSRGSDRTVVARRRAPGARPRALTRAEADHRLALANAQMRPVRGPRLAARVATAVRSAYGWLCRLDEGAGRPASGWR